VERGNDNGMRVSFAAEPEQRSQVEKRGGDTSATLSYAKREQQPVFSPV
jgi:hypothetical protein